MGLVAWQNYIQTDAGVVIPSPTVTVRNKSDGTLADIFEENGAAKDNPFSGAINGFVKFWAYSGDYTLVAAFGGVNSDVQDINLVDDAKGQPYPNRAAAAAANIPSVINRIFVKTPDGRTLRYSRAESTDGAALLSNGGTVGWEPEGKVWADHYAENTTPGDTDMRAAIVAAIATEMPVWIRGANAISARIDKVGGRISLHGEDPDRDFIVALASGFNRTGQTGPVLTTDNCMFYFSGDHRPKVNRLGFRWHDTGPVNCRGAFYLATPRDMDLNVLQAVFSDSLRTQRLCRVLPRNADVDMRLTQQAREDHAPLYLGAQVKALFRLV